MADWTISEGDICFVEIPGSDREALKRFYGQVFDWQFDDIPDMDYTMFKTSENGVLGGFGRIFSEMTGPAVSFKVNGDLASALEKVKASGGEVLVAEKSLGDMGSIALIKDPAGNLITLSKDPD